MDTPKEFEAVEENAVETNTDIKWYGKEDQTEYESIHDTGKGDAVVLRLFEFALRPDLEELPTREQILTPEYLKDLKVQLWKDGLRLVMEPRVFITKEKCQVFAPAVAATGVSHLEAPKLLQEWIS